MKFNRIFKSMLVMLGVAGLTTVAKADYTNDLVAQWNFSTGTAADLNSDIGGYSFTVAGLGVPTYIAGSVSIGDATELVATGINSAALPNLATNATVWVKMRFDAVPANSPVMFFGLMNATAPDDWGNMSMTAIDANWSGPYQIGQYSDTTTATYAQLWATPPAVGTTFTMALVLTAGEDLNGYPDPARTRFQTYVNGALVGSGACLGTNVVSQAFALGTLKASGGVPCTYAGARVYGQALTPTQIALIGAPAVPNTNGLVAQWNFSTGTAADLTSDIGGYAFAPLYDAPTYHVGSVSLDNYSELMAPGINSTALPALATNSTVWVKMKFDGPPANLPVMFFGLMNATTPADWGNMAMTGIYADWGGGLQIGQYANTATAGYGQLFASIPADGTSFSMALVLTSGLDGSGNPDATQARFQTYINGVSIGSGSAAGTAVPSLAFALGTLKASGGVPCTFYNARVYDVSLTAAEILALDAPPTPVITSVTRSGSNLIFSGTNGAANGTYEVLSSTNLALPAINWTPVLTNTFDGNGWFNVTNPIIPANLANFFLIKQ